MKSYVTFIMVCFLSALIAEEHETAQNTSEIYWDTPYYLAKLNPENQQYVYHRRPSNFIGNWILPLNMMPQMEEFSDIYEKAISKYDHRKQLLSRVIPTLNCVWNDVIFLSPLHPHHHFKEYSEIGFIPKHVQFFKIPVEVLAEKRTTVWKWLPYPGRDPIHQTLDSYCDLNLSTFQEMEELPEITKAWYREQFTPESPEKYPKYNWYRIPHILCQDPIDIRDERITIINWEDIDD
ncbi:MAG: hypothetical protein Q8K75_10835 [Chlamydiales bacterium]|nr:hypothetical protein [Chlamydiales bacterium]